MLPNFQAELERQKAYLGYHMVWRYTKAGRMPRVLIWLAENPQLADALAKDAKDLAKKQRDARK